MGVGASVNAANAPTPRPRRALRSSEETKNENGKGPDGLFYDHEFPPCDTSLYLTEDKSGVSWPSSIVWKRACQAKGLPKKVTDGQIGPGDIVQGTLGDCYLLSALSVLAERGERILRLLPSVEASSQGRYVVRLFKDGVARDVTVDDHFPCIAQAHHAQSGEVEHRAVFSSSRTDELWVLLVEKAYAKVHGAYKQIESGVGFHALEDLTGMPSTLLHLKDMDPNAAFDEILEADRRGYVMSVSTRAEDEAAKSLGLSPQHQYGLLQAKTLGDVKLVQLRNPWGSTEWTGEWSDASPLWTSESKAYFGWSNEDDGTFWMSIKHLVQYFETLSILVYEDEGWQTTALPLREGQELVELNIPPQPQGQSKISAWLSVKLEDKRCFHPDAHYEYPKVRFQVLRACPQDLSLQGVAHWSREGQGVRDVHEKMELCANATYHILLTRTPPDAPLTLALYAPGPPPTMKAVDSLTALVHRLQGGSGSGEERGEEEGAALLARVYESEVMRAGTVLGAGDEYKHPALPQQQEGIEEPLIYRKELSFPWGLAVVLVNGSSSQEGEGRACVEVTEVTELGLRGMTPLKLPNTTTLSMEAMPTPEGDDSGLKITQKVGPGERSCYVLFSSSLASAFAYSRRRLVLLRDTKATSLPALLALHSKALQQGIKQPLDGSDRVAGGADRLCTFSYDVPQGLCLLLWNSGESRAVLHMDVSFEVEGMHLWQLPHTRDRVLPPQLQPEKPQKEVGVSVRLEPGQSHLLVLLASEEGELSGFSFGYKFKYSLEPMHMHA